MQPREDTGNAIPSKEVAVEEVAVEEEDEEEDKYPSGVALWSILVPVTIGYFLMFLDTCVVATASPVITVRFDSLIDIGWYGGAYQLGNSAVQPLTGKIYSHFSTKAGYPNPYCLPSLLGASERARERERERDPILISQYSGPTSSFSSSSNLGLPSLEQLCHRPCSSSAGPSQVLGPRASGPAP